jgi:hypothetical protein
MRIQADLLNVSIEQVVDHIFSTRRITRADQECFMSLVLSKTSLSAIEETQINRVFDGLRRGLIRVVD